MLSFLCNGKRLAGASGRRGWTSQRCDGEAGRGGNAKSALKRLGYRKRRQLWGEALGTVCDFFCRGDAVGNSERGCLSEKP